MSESTQAQTQGTPLPLENVKAAVLTRIEEGTLYGEPFSKTAERIHALYADALREREEALRVAVDALHDVRKHHVRLNSRVGRPPHQSHTIGIVDTALVQLPPGTRAHSLAPEPDGGA